MSVKRRPPSHSDPLEGTAKQQTSTEATLGCHPPLGCRVRLNRSHGVNPFEALSRSIHPGGRSTAGRAAAGESIKTHGYANIPPSHLQGTRRISLTLSRPK